MSLVLFLIVILILPIMPAQAASTAECWGVFIGVSNYQTANDLRYCDDDARDIFRRTVDYVQTSGMEVPVFSILTPYPGTALRRRLMEEGRLLEESKDWRKYDVGHVLFHPTLMTPDELQEGYLWAKKYCCAPRSIISRLWHAPLKNVPLALALNFSMWRSKMHEIHAKWRGPLRAPAQW